MPNEPPAAADPPGKPIAGRTALIGLLFAVFVSLWGQYASAQTSYNYLTFPQMPLCLLLPFLLFVITPNLILRSRFPSAALNTSELIVIFCMGLIAAMVPDWGLVRYLISLIVAPDYYASPENQWEERFFEYLPRWLVVSDEKQAVTYFFAGLPGNETIPWSAWVVPLFWWFTAICALLFVGACLVVIMRRQWVEHERLKFPMGEVVLKLIESDDSDSRIPALYRNRTFHTGFLITICIMTWNVAAYWEVVPRIPIPNPPTSLVLDQAIPPINLRLVPYVLCFAFFVNIEILFSVWVFQLIGILETGVLNRMGIVSPATTIVPGGLVSIQFTGGLIMFVLWGFWMARDHLKSVYRHAIGKETDLSDDDELFSYRTAFFGLIAGFMYLVFWLHAIGLTIPIALLFLTLLFIFYLGIARVLAEAGLINLDLPINTHAFTIGIVGSANMTASTLTGLGLTNAFARNWRTFTMVALSHVAWFRGAIWPHRQRLALWITLSFLVSLFSSTAYVIFTGYDQGADNLHINLTNTGILFYDLIVKWMRNATRISEIEIMFLSTGAAVNMLLVAGRYLFFWWPLNPIGFVIGASGPIRGLTFTIFIAWLVKMLLLRLGGVSLYQKTQPLFLGILVGYVGGVAISYVVDSIWFPDTPHIGDIF